MMTSVLGGNSRFRISACVLLIIILESSERNLSDALAPASFSLLLASGSFPKMIKLAVLDLKCESEPVRERREWRR